ncbi:integrase [Nostoc sp. T09]|uniref:tyrosine-type recombinase/integrase n=1 Tax=Nostoc sp. T09 TaxID=1932621 RepID=UPI000A3AC0CB|nr:site-specific integrase [Nostoc sp. T09]OUL36932.1 integrase [Nostoc sp. T09]
MTQQISNTISIHPTLYGQLEVDWNKEYQGEFICPNCQKTNLKKTSYKENSICKLRFICNTCNKRISLTCLVPAFIYKYRSDIECPNPLCTQLGHDGQKGWIYTIRNIYEQCKCRYCGVGFEPQSTAASSWVNRTTEGQLLPFCFEDDIWYLRHFYDNPFPQSISFQNISPQWYLLEVKKYIQYLLKSRVYSSPSGVRHTLTNLKQFGKILDTYKIKQTADISREAVLRFLDNYKNCDNKTINHKLSYIKSFFEWLELDASHLIRSRDYLKESKNDADWLDEVTRTSIKEHLSKIPAPIARHYLVQEYTAARPGDICQLIFDCLVEENSKWYIKFYQHKTKRWHQVPATREIRQLIEEQQQWIRQEIGLEYSYLFCHFRNIRIKNYPTFTTMKPLPIPPPLTINDNRMVAIIRLLIEKEDIRDANGQRPHFTGKITRHNRLQEVRVKHGIEAAQLYADHVRSTTTFQNYTPPTREQVAAVDLPFQELLMNLDNKFLPWQSLPESLLNNPKAHELDLEIAPRLVVYGHCALDPKTPCPVNLYPKCYGCSSFRPSTGKLPLYERQYNGEQQRLTEAEQAGAELAKEEAKATIEAMDKWLPELRNLAHG